MKKNQKDPIEKFDLATPDGVIGAWMTLIELKKWRSMPKLTQKTWKKDFNWLAASNDIASKYGFLKIAKWEVVEIQEITEVFCKATVKLETNLGEKTIIANIIKEVAPFRTGLDGKWGINPISAMIF